MTWLGHNASAPKVSLRLISLILFTEELSGQVSGSKHSHIRVPEDYEYHCLEARNLSTSAKDSFQVNECSRAISTKKGEELVC